MNKAVHNQPKRSLAPLWIMVTIFAVPVFAAWIFYFNPEYLPASRSNKGTLIDPPRPITELHFQQLNGQSFPLGNLEGNWTMVTIAAGNCGERCEAQVHEMQQVRLALAENRYRLERVLILQQPEAGTGGEAIAEKYQGTRVLVAGNSEVADFERLFAVDARPVAGTRYLIDPFGNLMMQYAPEAPSKDMLHDLEKLFKASKNWIKGAQYGHR